MQFAATVKPTRPNTTALRWFFGLYFISVGVVHFVVPDGLPRFMTWMYELSDSLHVIAGTAEILGGLGLVLPHLVGVAPGITSAAAAGLSLVMIGAATWHGGRGEWIHLVGNFVVAGVMAYVAAADWRSLSTDALPGRTAATE